MVIFQGIPGYCSIPNALSRRSPSNWKWRIKNLANSLPLQPKLSLTETGLTVQLMLPPLVKSLIFHHLKVAMPMVMMSMIAFWWMHLLRLFHTWEFPSRREVGCAFLLALLSSTAPLTWKLTSVKRFNPADRPTTSSILFSPDFFLSWGTTTYR